LIHWEEKQTDGKMRSYRMLIGVIVLIILLLVIIILLTASLLMSTGNPPEGELSGIYGIVASLEAVLAGVITTVAEWIDYFASQIQKLAGIV
jgi:hypothetical protein